MTDTLHLNARSVSISDDGEIVSISLVTEDGQHALVKLKPLHWALIGEHAVGYAMGMIRAIVSR